MSDVIQRAKRVKGSGETNAIAQGVYIRYKGALCIFHTVHSQPCRADNVMRLIHYRWRASGIFPTLKYQRKNKGAPHGHQIFQKNKIGEG